MKDLSNDKMDKVFQAHFNHTTVPVENTDTLWAAIEEKRKPSKKSPLLWWVLALGGLALAASLAYGSFSSEKEETKIQKLSPIASNTPTSSLNQATIVKEETVTKEVSPHQNKTAILTKENKTPIANTSINQNSKSPNARILKPSIPKNTKLLIAKNEVLASKKNNTIALVSEPIHPHPFIPIHQQKVATPTSSLDNITSKQMLLLDHKPMPPVFKSAELVDDINKTKWDKCQVKQPGSFFIKGYGQAALPFEKVTYRSNDVLTETSNYPIDWAEKFSPFMSYSGGLQIGYTFPWQGYLSGGLAYQHFQTKFEETQRVIEQITIYDEMAYFYIDDMGETVWVADSVQLVNLYDQIETHPNNHQLWHIPIQFGYITDYNKFRIGGNIEALINISKSYKGYFMEANRSITVVDSNRDKDYMSTSLGISLSGGLYVGYQLGEHWEAYLSPRFRFNQASFLDKSQQLNITRNFAGLRAGLSYHF